MARQYLTLDMGAAGFPFLPPLQGARTLVPNLDQDKQPPRLLWVENMMPVSTGMATVGINPFITLPTTDPMYIHRLDRDHNVREVFIAAGGSTYFLFTSTSHWVYDSSKQTWAKLATVDSDLGETGVFFLKGQSYIFHPSVGLYTIEADLESIDVKVITGLNVSRIISMTSAVGYLLAVDSETLYWSSPLNELNFNPTGIGIDDGAGSSKQLSVRGDITTLVPKPNGAIIYTRENATEVTYTNQPTNPWVSTEILNSRGVSENNHVTSSNNSGIQFAWTDTGLKLTGNAKVQDVFPELTEFLSGDVAIDWNAYSKIFDKVTGIRYRTAFKHLGGKYLCVSYGRQNDAFYQYSLIYDQTLQRWGKLRHNHLALFEATVPTSGQVLSAEDFWENNMISAEDVYDTGVTAGGLLLSVSEGTIQNSIALLDDQMSIRQVDFADYDNPTSSGTLVFGQISLTRSRSSKLTDVEIERLDYSDSVTNPIPSVLVKSFVHKLPTAGASVAFSHYPSTESWLGMSSGKEHQLEVTGALSMASLAIALNPQGRR